MKSSSLSVKRTVTSVAVPSCSVLQSASLSESLSPSQSTACQHHLWRFSSACLGSGSGSSASTKLWSATRGCVVVRRFTKSVQTKSKRLPAECVVPRTFCSKPSSAHSAWSARPTAVVRAVPEPPYVVDIHVSHQHRSKGFGTPFCQLSKQGCDAFCFSAWWSVPDSN